MFQQRTEWRRGSRADTAIRRAATGVLICGSGLITLFELCSHTAWPGGHGPGLMVNAPQKLPDGLRREQ
eukprot:4667842-Prymnesium_polylepis.1